MLSKELLQDGSLEVVRAIAESVPRIREASIRQGVLKGLENINDQPGIDMVWATWARCRDTHLETFLCKKSLPATSPANIKLLSALKLGRPETILNESAEIIESLLAACEDKDQVIVQGAREVLTHLQNAAAQEELCRQVIEHDHSLARQAAIACGYAPREPQRRALFYILTEQWERYEQLDFDSSLLRTVYETVDAPKRAKIAALARQAGWAGFVDAVAGKQISRRLGALSEVEWDVIQTILTRNRRWEDLWWLAQAAPPFWSAGLLQILQEAGWAPEKPEEQSAFAALAQSAAACLEHGRPVEKFIRSQKILEGHTGKVTDLAFGSQGETLISASADRTVRLWNLPSADLVKTLNGHTSFVLSLAVSPDGRWLASGSGDKTTRLWGLPGGDLATTLAGHTGEVAALAFHPSGELLASGDAHAVRLWQIPSGRLFRILDADAAASQALSITLHENLLIAGLQDQSLHLWQIPDGQNQTTLMETVSAWGLTPDGSQLVSASSYGRLRLWRLPSAELLQTLPGHIDGKRLALSPDGSWLAASDRNDLNLVRIQAKAEPVILAGHTRPITAIAFSPDGQLLVSASQDETIRLWQIPQGKPLQTLEGQSGPVHLLRFTPAGQSLVSADKGSLRILPVDDLSPLFRNPGRQISREAINRFEESLWSADISEREQHWIEFCLALIHWQRRFDIEISDAPDHILVGDFDIEISG